MFRRMRVSGVAPMARRMQRPTVGRLAPYFIAFLAGDVASEIQGIAVAWHIFRLHHRPFDLGLVGLTLFLPSALLVLVTGLYADRHDRRSIMMVTTFVEIAAAAAFLGFVLRGAGSLWPYLGALLVVGVARAFGAPAERGLLLALVPESEYLRVSAAYASVRKFIAIGSPAIGGALVALGVSVALGTCIGLLAFAAAGLIVLRLPVRSATVHVDAASLDDALGGMRFIRAQPVILAAISLDLFAVLFGGATALLPAYADTILHTGPLGLGLMRSAPAVGAFGSAAFLARRPLARNIGRTLLVAVAIFGAATIVFGLSRLSLLSLAALVVLGAADMVSVVIRSGIVQLGTPDAMRGRVSAVENVFIGASNELGEFESGSLAALIGVVPAVVSGGFATLAIVAIVVAAVPRLRHFDRFASAPAI